MRIGTVITQQLDNLSITARVEDGGKQRRVTVCVSCIDGCTGFEQDGSNIGSVALCGEVQRCPAIVVGRISDQSRGKKLAYTRCIALKRSIVEGGSTHAVHARAVFSFGLFARHRGTLVYMLRPHAPASGWAKISTCLMSKISTAFFGMRASSRSR